MSTTTKAAKESSLGKRSAEELEAMTETISDDNKKDDADNTTTLLVGPITADGEMPKKRFYRQRAHCNPLAHNDSFVYPYTLQDDKWLEEHFPNLPADKRHPTVLDVGCGFGGLTVALASLLPDQVILGLEIRAKVTEYVRLRILALRKDHPGLQYENCSVLRTNSMKFSPNFFPKSSIEKLFFCFPDPHFKRKNHGRRIVSERLLSEYAYLLKQDIGRLYCITDVKELHEWHVQKCDAHPLFQRLDEDKVEQDPCVKAMIRETEEAKKVERLGGDNTKGEKYYAVYKRISNTEMERLTASNFFSEQQVEEEEEETKDD